MPATYSTIMTALFFFSCSYFSPWFYISLFNWLEENKAEKWDSKVNIWNAVALTNHFLVFCEMDKGFMSRYVEYGEYMHYWFKEELCLGLNIPTASWTNLHCAPIMVTPLLLSNVMGLLCLWQTRSYHSAAFLQPATCTKPVTVSSRVGTPLFDGFRLLGHTFVQFYLLSKDTSFLRGIRKVHPDIKSITASSHCDNCDTISNRRATS